MLLNERKLRLYRVFLFLKSSKELSLKVVLTFPL